MKPTHPPTEARAGAELGNNGYTGVQVANLQVKILIDLGQIPGIPKVMDNTILTILFDIIYSGIEKSNKKTS